MAKWQIDHPQAQYQFELWKNETFVDLHLERLPAELKEEIKEFYVQGITHRRVERSKSTQYNLVIGLIDIVYNIGKHCDGAYDILNRMVQDDFCKEVKELDYFVTDYGKMNVYKHICSVSTLLKRGVRT